MIDRQANAVRRAHGAGRRSGMYVAMGDTPTTCAEALHICAPATCATDTPEEARLVDAWRQGFASGWHLGRAEYLGGGARTT